MRLLARKAEPVMVEEPKKNHPVDDPFVILPLPEGEGWLKWEVIAPDSGESYGATRHFKHAELLRQALLHAWQEERHVRN